MRTITGDCLAVVPARGGSKGLPGKNLAIVGAFSLVARAVSVGRACPLVSSVIVSTDDEDIAREAQAYGGAVPFIRDPALATDKATSADVWKDAHRRAEVWFETLFPLSVLLEPTSPLRTSADIVKVLGAMTESGFDSAMTVSALPAKADRAKQLEIGPTGRVHLPTGVRHFNVRRQDVAKAFYRNGICYASRRTALFSDAGPFGGEILGVIKHGDIVNIDSGQDLATAEVLLSRLTVRSIR